MDPTLPRISVRDLMMQAFLTGWELSDKTVSQDEYLQSSIQVIEMLQVEPENLYAEEGLGLPDGEEVDHLDDWLRADGQKKAGIRPVDRHADIAHQMHRAGHGQRQQAQDQNSRDPFSGVSAPAILHRRRLRLPVLCGIVVIEAVVVKAHIRHPLAWLCT